jgi:16S rRNA (cytosine1402-N4)-methyltransferase
MDPRSTLTAADIVNGYSEEDLTRLFRDLGEEPAARRIASLIVKMRKDAPLTETLQLARAIEKVVGRHGRRHPATQAFQALRMEVNDELGALEQGMRVLTARLEAGARIAVITFHSLEDRIVKNFIRDHSREWLDRPEWPEPRRNPEYDLRAITSKPIEPGENERRINPHAGSC